MDTKLAEEMAANARDAVDLSKTRFQVDLDYTVDSLQLLEQLFDRVQYSMPDPESTETTGLLTRLWGGYFGEVMRRHLGGEWLLWKDEHGRAIALQVGRATIFPLNKVKKRLERGAGHNIWEFYQELSAALSKS